jgi:hypothetical protein
MRGKNGHFACQLDHFFDCGHTRSLLSGDGEVHLIH